jgi:hypothetical protein
VIEDRGCRAPPTGRRTTKGPGDGNDPGATGLVRSRNRDCSLSTPTLSTKLLGLSSRAEARRGSGSAGKPRPRVRRRPRRIGGVDAVRFDPRCRVSSHGLPTRARLRNSGEDGVHPRSATARGCRDTRFDRSSNHIYRPRSTRPTGARIFVLGPLHLALDADANGAFGNRCRRGGSPPRPRNITGIFM